MPTVSVFIPQIGEGLQEARLVAVLKQPGDKIRRDEPIYQMETDKAVMDVESPVEGVLVSWTAKADDVLPIGAEICKVEVASDVAAPVAPTHGGSPAPQTADSTTESVVALRIPQIGEGLQEARLVAKLKNPGDTVKRDDVIYQMETDKAVMDVESPYAGVLVEWLAEVDAVLPIGAEVGRMRVTGPVQEMAAGHGPAPTTAPTAPAAAQSVAPGGARRTDIPPRTRAYAKEKGVTEADLATIPASGSKLMPADIDAFLAGGASAPASTTTASGNFVETPVGGKQRVLNSRMVRGNQLVVPGTISLAVRWEALERVREKYRAAGGDFQPSTFTIFSYAVAKVISESPGFRTSIIGDHTFRTYNHCSLGVAVSLPGDELVIATVENADALTWRDFAAEMRARIALARGGQDQAHEAVTISLTNMQSFGLRDAVPVVVPPSMATLFLGEVYKGIDQESDEVKIVKYANIALTFDHRVVNGVGASTFIARIKEMCETIESWIEA
jgi:pyruvate/2-oxoglutarate dehydrogenase complex dihydrolipoamide acyltransferase (E2) component